jgi:outer membrane protein TolC
LLSEQRRLLAEELRLGKALERDLLEADINIAETRLNIGALEIEKTEAEKVFAIALGLETLPELSEAIDVTRVSVIPSKVVAASTVRAVKNDLKAAALALLGKEEELRIMQNLWFPAIKLNGTFSASVQRYPLNHYTWSLSLSFYFSTPFFNSKISGLTGGEDRNVKTARSSASLNPYTDPSISTSIEAAKIALALDKKKYLQATEDAGRQAELAVDMCALSEKKRLLSLESANLYKEKTALAVTKQELGLITTLELMSVQIEERGAAIAVVEQAIAVLEKERELESLLELPPGELKHFVDGGR